MCIETTLHVYRNDFDLYRNNLYRNDFVSERPDTFWKEQVITFATKKKNIDKTVYFITVL